MKRGIKNLARIGTEGLEEMDRLILDMMVSKKKQTKGQVSK